MKCWKIHTPQSNSTLQTILNRKMAHSLVVDRFSRRVLKELLVR